jgi:hypothetical protein
VIWTITAAGWEPASDLDDGEGRERRRQEILAAAERLAGVGGIDAVAALCTASVSRRARGSAT